MRLIEFSNQSVSFADCKAILLMLRWRAISSSKYISIDASIISIYSLSAAPLVVTRKKDIPRLLWKCPIHTIDIFVAYLLHMCCIPLKFQHIWQLPTTSVTLVKWAFLDFSVWEKLSLWELRCATSSLQTLLREFLSCFSLIFRAFPAFCFSVIRCADHKKRPFFIQR